MENLPNPRAQHAVQAFQLDVNPREQAEEVYSVRNANTTDGTNDLGVAFPTIFPAGYKIPWGQLPHPFTGILGAGAVYKFKSAIAFSIVHCADRSYAVGRPLTLDECDALVYHGIKGNSIASYGPMLGGVAGFLRYRFANAKGSFRYPFYKPDMEKINFDKFLGLRNSAARMAWRSSSLGAYVIVGSIVGRTLIASYAASVNLTGELKDPRLRDYFNELRQLTVNRPPGSRPPIPTPQSNDSNTYDSASPQSQYGSDAATAWSSGNQPGMMSDEQVASSNRSSGSSFNFDDASPVAQRAPDTQSSNDSGSAWERLRRGQSQPPSASPSQPSRSMQTPQSPQQQQEQSATGDNLADYDRYEVERQRTKEQAQKEFDARLDRERRGESFDDDDRKWR